MLPAWASQRILPAGREIRATSKNWFNSSRQLPQKLRVVTLPEWTGKAGLPFVKLLGIIQNKEPLYTIESLKQYSGGIAPSAVRKKRTDYSARPLAETIRDTFEWFTNKGYLV